MTLNTRVYVVDEIDPMTVFRKCQQLLSVYDEQHRTPEQQEWRQDDTSIYNRIDQGLPGILDVDHGVNGPLRTEGQHKDYCNVPGGEHYDASEGSCDGSSHPPCWLEVSFDTVYGYSDPEARGCGDLHACMVAELGTWLDGQGVAWKWQNEYTGEIHDSAEKLVELVADGFASRAWFQQTVMPAITTAIVRGEL